MKFFDEATHLELMMRAPQGHTLIGYLPSYSFPSGVEVQPLFLYKGQKVAPVYQNDDIPEYRALIGNFWFVKLLKKDGGEITYIVMPHYYAIQAFKDESGNGILMFFNKWGSPVSTTKQTSAQLRYTFLHLGTRLLRFLFGRPK